MIQQKKKKKINQELRQKIMLTFSTESFKEGISAAY